VSRTVPTNGTWSLRRVEDTRLTVASVLWHGCGRVVVRPWVVRLLRFAEPLWHEQFVVVPLRRPVRYDSIAWRRDCSAAAFHSRSIRSALIECPCRAKKIVHFLRSQHGMRLPAGSTLPSYREARRGIIPIVQSASSAAAIASGGWIRRRFQRRLGPAPVTCVRRR
jgi:hypothetical protein